MASAVDQLTPHYEEKSTADAEEVARRVGVLIPCTNTVVEHDFWRHGTGLRFLTGRIPMVNQDLSTDSSEQTLVRGVAEGTERALVALMVARPSMVVLGVSAASFTDGLHGLRRREARWAELSRVPIITGASAVIETLRQMSVGNIGILSPYRETNISNVESLFRAAGYEVTATVSLNAKDATGIAEVPHEDIVAGARRLAQAGVEAIVQLGTNLPAFDLHTRSEDFLGVPFIPINRALLDSVYRRVKQGER